MSVRQASVHSMALWALAVAMVLPACATRSVNTRMLHYVDGELVYSRPVSARGYEAYLRARVALEAEPPALAVARQHIEQAVRYDPREPHLWTTRAEIEHKAGNDEAALASLRRALALRPGYAPAEKLMAQLGQGGPASASAKTSKRSP